MRLTRRGKNVIDRAVETHLDNEERLLGVLTAGERRTLDRVLKSLLIELERAERRYMSVVDVGQSSSGRWLWVGESDGFQLGRGSLPSNGRTAAAFDEGRATEGTGSYRML